MPNARAPMPKMSFLDNRPAVVLVEVPPVSGPLTPAIDDELKWLHFRSFIEVRPDLKEGPNTTNATVVKQIM
jgi:hypothetical protein